ncbi:flavodoxin domain-containing protein [Psychrosphaera sp. B3R10]|uniref:flavodoxin domain-containing protein n=1 Tax=unclassified Psychrosphaera TaxID=2641570 RepID=UPI001C091B96|nr:MULTISPECIES: flavodoxin domain-containing protein [unclassified Psychrosphaera]MBU2883308.1 flavodoxin domain-containing protein [Psychrosphaera sp. I2R16]MBU2990598.1 flavodoxin domain-containing protein [Psychrosphaera sp. B3R10]MDO6718928.1 flavodoxin domain-containing protein [Psychrosphaera sp. 1_MG-2023]
MRQLIIGTETGTAEFVGDDISALLEQYNLPVEVTLEPEYDSSDTKQLWIFCTSTHGAGEIPNNLKPFLTWLENTKPDLFNVSFIVIGLGDSSYDTYCKAAYQIESILLKLGANKLTETFTVDAMDEELPEDLIIPWLKSKLDLLN